MATTVYMVNYQGLRKRESYNEIVDYLENKQEKVNYPNRFAKQIRNSPQLSNLLDGEGMGAVEMEEQQMKAMEHEQAEQAVRQAGGTAQVLRAAASQTDKQVLRAQTNVGGGGYQPTTPQMFDMTLDDSVDAMMDDIQDELDKQKALLEQKAASMSETVANDLASSRQSDPVADQLASEKMNEYKGVKKDIPGKNKQDRGDLRLLEKKREKQDKKATGKASSVPLSSIAEEQPSSPSSSTRKIPKTVVINKINKQDKDDSSNLKRIKKEMSKQVKKATGSASSSSSSAIALAIAPPPAKANSKAASPPTPPQASQLGAVSKAKPRTKPVAEQFGASSKAKPRTTPVTEQLAQVGVVGDTGGPDGPKRRGRPKGSKNKPKE